MVTRISTILFACALVLFMTVGKAAAADDIRNSRHNMSVTGQWNTTEDTTRICVFCHTPHGGHDGEDTPPLWNKNWDTSQAYDRHNMMDNAVVGGTTLACLQCHDGTQALDTMINGPGSGEWTNDLVGASQGYTFLEFDSFGSGAGTGEVSWLGTDLRNDHPVSIAFAEAGCFGTTGMGAAYDCSAVDPDEFNTPTMYMPMHGGKLSFMNGIKVTGRDPLDFGAAVQAAAAGFDIVLTVECASCHNPHLGNEDAGSTQDDATQMFLRVADNDGRAICLTCHVK